MNYKLKIQYDGGRYDGWQRQGNTNNTIQGKIEDVLKKMTDSEVEVCGAGRTDAGVHAIGQVANVHMNTERSFEEICSYLNQYLPEDIGVTQVERAAERFHARLNAAGKIYTYRIGNGYPKNVFERKYIYSLPDRLNTTAMREAAKILVGTHDFKSFCTNKKMKKSTVRRLDMIHIEEKDGEIDLIFQGDGFLYNMVRILTGTLIEVGQNKREVKAMRDILNALNRQEAGFTAPARGLTLTKVIYENEEW